MNVLSSLLAAVGFAAALALPVQAAEPAKGDLSAVFKQLGVPVEARFKSFTAAIDYDPANVAQAKAQVSVDVASFDLGDPDYNKEVLKKDWFDAANHPKASFVATTIKAPAAGKLEVSGKLTIKGRSQDVKVPVTVRQDGARQVFEGSLPISRLYFNIGEGEWKDTSMVADEVLVKFKVVK